MARKTGESRTSAAAEATTSKPRLSGESRSRSGSWRTCITGSSKRRIRRRVESSGPEEAAHDVRLGATPARGAHEVEGRLVPDAAGIDEDLPGRRLELLDEGEQAGLGIVAVAVGALGLEQLDAVVAAQFLETADEHAALERAPDDDRGARACGGAPVQPVEHADAHDGGEHEDQHEHREDDEARGSDDRLAQEEREGGADHERHDDALEQRRQMQRPRHVDLILVEADGGEGEEGHGEGQQRRHAHDRREAPVGPAPRSVELEGQGEADGDDTDVGRDRGGDKPAALVHDAGPLLVIVPLLIKPRRLPPPAARPRTRSARR